MSILNVLPFAVYLFWLFLNIKRVGRIIALSNFIIALYTLSMFSFLICSILNANYIYSFQAFLLISIVLIILIEPLTQFEAQLSTVTKSFILNEKRNKLFSWALIFIGIYSVLFFASNLHKVFNSDLSTLRQLIETEGGFYQSNIFSKIAVFGAYLFPISLFLSFYTFNMGSNKKRALLLFLTSFSFVLYTLNVAGRDGIIIWMISYLALLGLFNPFMSDKAKKMQSRVFLSIVGVVVPVFLLISIKRFSSEGHLNNEVIFSLFDYLGQQLHELSTRMEKLENSAYGGEPRNIIPLVYSFLNTISGNASDAVNRFDLRLDSMAFGLETYKFTYFVGDILTETGFLGVILFTGVSYSVFRRTLVVRCHRVSLPRLIIAFSWYMVILVGVFYFYYGQLVGNVFLLFPFMLFVFYNLKQNKSYSTILGRHQKPL